MFGLVTGDTLYLKTDEDTRPLFVEAGCEPFVYLGQKKPITTSYWTVPDEAMETAQDMRPWARHALGAALRKANAPKKKAAKKPLRGG